jgi:hypothetical protein
VAGVSEGSGGTAEILDLGFYLFGGTEIGIDGHHGESRNMDRFMAVAAGRVGLAEAGGARPIGRLPIIRSGISSCGLRTQTERWCPF